ncbi:hypothetical protein BUALT_Bualt02G0073800 [Buddleja alternifolia]|uniref:NAB domain-containing protein n=1 Tax=Buddleja alternifolia TaxID=168488 RepID=A0AAV6Y0D8_9LAMI|nr:hypothetical protein BUALT_Bualt02G0073800 [Buddleja alternifolia]
MTRKSLTSEMDQHVKRMLMLIEEDADSFAKKAEMYYQKRPELIRLVEEFYRMYRSLAERHDNVTGELRKNIPSDLLSQGSSSISNVGSEPPSTFPSPECRLSNRKSGPPRAAGFDFFLGNDSELNNNKEGDESSTLDSESESDDSSVNDYSATHSNDDEHHVLQRKIMELEIELREVQEKLRRVQDEEIYEGSYKKSGDGNFEVNGKITAIDEEEVRMAKEKIELSEEEITCLRIELHNYKSLDSVHKIQTLEEELRITQEKLHEFEEKIAGVSRELISKGSTVQTLQDELESAQKEVTAWKNKLEKEKREVSKLQEHMTRYKTNVSDRDQEIRGLKEATSNANKSLSEVDEQLQAEITRISMEDNVKEMDLHCQSLEEDARRLKAKIAEAGSLEEVKKSLDALQLKYETEKDNLNMMIDALGAEVNSKDDEIEEMNKHLHQLHMELIDGAEGTRKLAEELRARIRELEREVETKQEIIVQGAEEKREAIWQLCFSLEHYRNGYHRLREAVMGHKRMPVLAS